MTLQGAERERAVFTCYLLCGTGLSARFRVGEEIGYN